MRRAMVSWCHGGKKKQSGREMSQRDDFGSIRYERASSVSPRAPANAFSQRTCRLTHVFDGRSGSSACSHGSREA